MAILAFACAALAVALVAPGAFATSRADPLDAAEAKLAQCKGDLTEAREAITDTKAILALARKHPFVFLAIPGLSGTIPVDVRTATDATILLFVTGKISRADLTRRLHDLTIRARETVQVLKSLIEDAEQGERDLEKKCQALLAERNRLRSRGGTTTTPTTTAGTTGAYPGGTATKLTLTIGSGTVTTDLKTGKMSAEPTIKVHSSTTVDGSVKLDGTLPAGWTVAAFHGGSDILLNSPTGGSFTVKPPFAGFDAFTRPGAYICNTKVPPLCSPAAQANITIDWDP